MNCVGFVDDHNHTLITGILFIFGRLSQSVHSGFYHHLSFSKQRYVENLYKHDCSHVAACCTRFGGVAVLRGRWV